ncbi:MAG: class I tRNA ligase family protein, partial [Lachnospiraceae bacterium]|nr:class I tRNA ligase family protein [Lachnospiraceae bacterium]
FSTLGWPKKTPELDYFSPTDVLVTGYDIIGFWVSRMIFSGLAYTDKAPFHTVYIHGLVRDALGRKMSKSLGNGIDPLEIIDLYGIDAVRMMLLIGNAPGNDMRFITEKVESCRNFANKVWNASRFIMMNLEKAPVPETKPETLTEADKWILSKANTVVREVTDNMEKFELGIALGKIYDFTWDEFCDWYIEMVKPRLYNDADETKSAALYTLKEVLIKVLKLLHPYMPFITEEIFTNLQDKEETIMLSAWPEYKPEDDYPEEESHVEILKEAIRAIRSLRTDMNVAPSRKANVHVVSDDGSVREIFRNSKSFFSTLAFASDVFVEADRSNVNDSMVSAVTSRAVLFIPLADLVDFEKERERLNKERERIENEISRSNNMLNNPRFVEKAPADKVAAEKEKLAKYEGMLEEVKARLNALS